MKNQPTKNQTLAIATIVLVAILLGVLIWTKDSTTAKQGKDEASETSSVQGQPSKDSGQAASTLQQSKQRPKVAFDDEQIKSSGIIIKEAGPASIETVVSLPGEIRFNEDKTAHVVPRVAGVVESVRANLGQTVKKGQVLAVLASTSLSEQRSELLAAQKRLALARTTHEREKTLWQEKISAEQDYLQARQVMQEAEIAVHNAQQKLDALGSSARGGSSLNTYEVRAPFGGIVMEKHLSLGEAVKDDANIFTISDLSTVWAEFAVPAQDLQAVRIGEPVTVRATAFDAKATGVIAYVGSLLGEQTRTAKARVALANPDMAWRPGLLVSVDVVSGKRDAPVAVSTEAVQSVENRPTVFLRVPGGFVAQPVTLGRSNGKMVEVTGGLKPGDAYVASNSFLVKSELGKSDVDEKH